MTTDLHLTALDPSHLQMAKEAVRRGALQDEWEFASLLELVRRTGVSRMLEIGSYTGGSLWAWRQVVPNVLSVTLGTETGFQSHGASIVYGDSTDPATQASAESHIAGAPVDFVFIDGGHDYHTALSDFMWARRLVRRGLIGLHDINLDLRYPMPEFSGPRQLWDEARGSFPTFEIANVRHDDPGVGVFFVR